MKIQSPTPCDCTSISDSKEVARASLAKQFAIESAFVKVSTLSKVLGLAPATIYSSIRRGTFFLPHRMLGAAPAVKFDDLVAWYCIEPAEPRAPAPRASAIAPHSTHWNLAEMDDLVATVRAKIGADKPRALVVGGKR